MLTIKTTEGLDLVLNPPPDNLILLKGAEHLPVLIALNLVEDDANLPTASATGTLNWNDGGLPVTFFGAGTVAITDTRSLKAGNYVVKVEGRNFKAPSPDRVQVQLGLLVRQQRTEADPPRNVYGPILPRDTGYPNVNQWAFSLGSDIQILESSVKMLLLTELGERVMEPEYGTNIKRLLFEANVSAIESAIQEEIVRATTRWEPRVALRSLTVQRTNDRAVVVTAVFTSKLTQQPFRAVLNFAR